ncbi:MAG: hypothetical protein A3J10_01400 [Candidatus Sungbacteria bacterium RIFCSPLOWO2_02_FULL_54_10]|uniref:Uncharacterized protein n=2 Tax=Candidatus Sungiibacteriota TaxID=1817917 RepID=A0A1G2L900_9BACT|nr:MAG: hypothetical protein A2679_00900 [Candidatus Sungbacteria bacterium RIFCSPHIGHO2_01_FULL_54_26]OHA03198.1 MAG: hypothetical protein A3C92_01640 [Candidatus Sungbacteria bacterium RIFCSPHIGHO2_02_FULL_53_17]OHA08118.1 MAG: hypothetical protein A3B34_01680 [Candidatus Sungbacteria bacterium RIFCSPLOWO2_01_FULL_54_21]OHA13666.1 MAG: hypothetical protein A3J10_01400 [Candidatus Sungbacteria bacterium RIFCSPLOWO2_02_FULL_54_10]
MKSFVKALVVLLTALSFLLSPVPFAQAEEFFSREEKGLQKREEMEAQRKKTRDERDAKRKADREVRDQKREDRRELIKEQGKAFQEKSVPVWKDQVQYGEERGAIASVCRKFVDFERRAEALDTLKKEKIQWHRIEASVRADDAYSKFRKDGVALAGELVEVVDIAHRAYRCSGIDFTDGVEILEKAIDVLERVKAKPDSIGKTPAEFRALVLEQFKEQVRNARASGNGSPALKRVYQRAHGWSFSPDDIGMTAEEARQAAAR